jgi:hypothetical protein
MILTLVEIRQIELIVTNKRVLEETLVLQFDSDLALFELVNLFILWLEEDMLVPNGDVRVSDIILRRCKLTLPKTIDFDNRVYFVLSIHQQIFRALHIHMNHVVTAFHLTNFVAVVFFVICTALVIGIHVT